MLYAAVNQVKITPPIGTPMSGYWARKGVSQGVHDDLYARALVLTDQTDTVVLVSLDIIALDDVCAREIKKAIERATSIPSDHVVLCTIQTHSGPDTIFKWQEKKGPVERFLAELRNKTVLMVKNAIYRVAPARLGTGSILVPGLTLNRESEGGPVDEELVVVKVDDLDGRPAAVLLNYTCHPVVLGPENLLFSADFPGAVVNALQEKAGPGMKAIFTHGAAGNINPRERGSFQVAQAMGQKLAVAAFELFDSIDTTPGIRIAADSKTIALPARELPEITLDQARSDLEKAKTEWERTMGERESEKFLYAFELYELLKSNQAAYEVELQVIRIGDLSLICFPGELYVETGLKLKKACPSKHTAIIDLANGCVGYVPPREYMDRGVYGARLARWSKLAPQCCQIVEDEFYRMLSAIPRT